MPPIDDIAAAAHERGIPVFVDAAQLAPHRRLPSSIDYVAWSGHKMYAPFGAGALVGPRRAFADGDPFLAGGGAVDLVDLDEVVWTDPPEREEAGSPNVVGAVALQAAIDELDRIGWPPIEHHDDQLARRLRSGLGAIPGVTVLGPGLTDRGGPERVTLERGLRRRPHLNLVTSSRTNAAMTTSTRPARTRRAWTSIQKAFGSRADLAWSKSLGARPFSGPFGPSPTLGAAQPDTSRPSARSLTLARSSAARAADIRSKLYRVAQHVLDDASQIAGRVHRGCDGDLDIAEPGPHVGRPQLAAHERFSERGHGRLKEFADLGRGKWFDHDESEIGVRSNHRPSWTQRTPELTEHGLEVGHVLQDVLRVDPVDGTVGQRYSLVGAVVHCDPIGSSGLGRDDPGPLDERGVHVHSVDMALRTR